MHLKKLFLNSLPLLLLGTVMVYAAAPSGGYLPGATTDPDCAVGDTDCFVTLPTDQDNQNLTLSGTNLSIEDGNSVTLPSFTDTNTQLTETQVDDYVANNGYLTGYTDTDDQTLTLSGSDLSIADGNSVTLPSFTDTNTQLTETEVDSFVANNGYLTGYTDTDNQTLTLSGSNLSISDGNSVSLSGISGSNIWTQTGSTTYYNEGNVGIGTTSPQAKLDVNGETKSLAYKSMNDGTLTSVAYKIGNDNDNGLYRPANNTIGFVTTANERMRITSAGNVGIGTTTPAESLHILNGNQVIESSTSAYTRYMDNGATPRNFYSGINFDAAPNVYSIGNKDTDTSFVTVDLNGNVGIGTTAPTYKLEVSGANSDASINGVRVGKGGGDVSTNTVVGNGALNSNTTGIHNTANGYLVLNNNTTGHSNTAMGYTALRYNTTGFRNAAYGYAALASNTTGYYNTANGYQSLYFNTTGNTNTANGYQSLYFNTTGYQNAANGYRALHSNTTGIRNSAQGSFALDSNTTGSYNTSNGSFALHLNTTGHSNTVNGYQALYDNTTGNYNTAVGMYSLRHSTGSTNTAFGYQAGDNITAGSNNIIIGANTDAVSATADNQLNIGNWIYGDNGKIGIGTTTPDSKMQVNYGTLADVDLSDIRKTTALTLSGNDPGTTGDSKGVSLTMRPIIGRGAVSAITTLNDGANKEGNANMTFMTGQGGHPSVMTEHMRIVGSTGNILIGGDSQVGGADPKLLVRNADDALTTGNYAATELLQLSREGTYGDKWSANAQFKLGSYSNHPSARSSLEIALTDVNNDSVYNTVMTMNGNGNVGIGTTAPTTNLDIKNNATGTEDPVFRVVSGADRDLTLLQPDGSNINDPFTWLTSNAYQWRVDGVDAMTIDAVGNVGIGTTVPNSLLTVSKEVASGTAPSMLSVVATGGANLPGFYVDLDEDNNKVKLRASGNSSPDIAFGSLFNDRLTIKGAGNVGIGTSTPAQKLDVNGNIAVSGTTVHTSDGRLKTNIEDIDNALERILTIKGVSYNWKKETNNSPDRQIGVIAQDVEVEFPELVLENGEYKSVNYSGLIGPIIEAIRDIFTKFLGFKEETNDKFEVMEQRIAELEKRIAELESQ